ncbi:acetate kinase [Agromyces sp. NPDC058484]|uniref:acetate kinase n=1 Tax=Agromyces sp. NPDC058484 TaxID=3346524 RepID=UPI0036487570
MSVILVINSGSSSLKYQLIDMDAERTLATGLIERIGRGESAATHTVRHPSSRSDAAAETFRVDADVPDHDVAFARMLDAFAEHGPSLDANPPIAVGHRVVQGGARFFEPTIVTDRVKRDIEELEELAPLHNPANLAGITAAERAFPGVPHVAIFDTAFHQTLPPAAYTYAIDADVAEKYRVRRYGFHGTSHKYVSEQAALIVGRPLAELRQLVLHLGNGASITAVDGGRSVETSMGLTPLEGLVMGTRSGDIDPAVLFHLHRRAGLDVDELDSLLNKRSGLLGLAGTNDVRDVLERRAAGDAAATLAFDVYVHRIKGYVGAYFAQLGGVDVISFTAGVGENAAPVRAESLSGLERLGILIDAERNESASREARVISTDDSEVTVLVIPTNEELEIARQTLAIVEG